MCDTLHFGERTVANRETFQIPGSVSIIRNFFTREVTSIDQPIYWDGWARDDAIDAWLQGGKWKRADIRATQFSISTKNGRLVYDVPPHQVIKAIALETPTQVVIRVISRESEGTEAKVCQRFAKTGKQILGREP